MKTLAPLLIALLAAAAHAEPLCVAPDERVPFSDGEVLACAGEVPPLTVVREQPVYDRVRGEWRQAVLFRFAQPAPWEAVVSGAVRLRGVTLADEPAADAEALRLGDQLWAVAPPGHYEDPGDCSAAGAIIAPHPRRGIEAGEDLLRVDPSGERIRFELAAAGELDDFRLVLVSPDPATAARVDVEIYPALTTPGVEVQVGSPDLDVAPDDGRYGVDAPIPLRLREGDVVIPEACVAGRLDSDRFFFDLVVPADSARLDDRNGALSPMPALGAPVALRWRVFRVESPPGPPLEVVGLDGLDYGLCLDGDEVLPLEALLAAPAGMAEGVHFVRISVWDDRDGDRGFDGIEPGDTVRLAVVVGPDVDGDPCLLRPARPEDDGGVVDLDGGVADDGGVEDGGADAGDAEADGGDGPLLVGDFGGDGGAAGGADGGAGDGGGGGAGDGGRVGDAGLGGDGGAGADGDGGVGADAGLDRDGGVDGDGSAGADAGLDRDGGFGDGGFGDGGFGDGGFGDGGFGDGGVGGDAAPDLDDGLRADGSSGSDGGLDGDGSAAGDAGPGRDDSGSADGGSGDAGLADGPATDALPPADGAPTDGATPDARAPLTDATPLDAAPADRPDARPPLTDAAAADAEPADAHRIPMPDADPGDPQGGALSCTARPGGAPASPALLIALLALLALARRARPRRAPTPRHAHAAAALLLAALLPAPTRAQDVRRFTPAPTPSPYLTLDGARTLGAGELGLRLLSAVEQRPLVFARDGEATVEIIDLRLALDLAATYGLTDWLDLGLSLPLVAAQRGRAIEADTPLATTALADPALALKARLIDPRHGAGLALRLSATAPWGDPAALAGEPGYTAAAVLALELPLHHRFDLALNAGYRLRPRTALGAIPLDDELAFGAAASWRATPAVALAAEFSAATAAADPFARPQQTPGALDLTTRIALTGPLAAVAGVGLGLLPGYGAPLYRAFIGVELAPRWHDHDGDGLADGRDRCLDTPGVPAEAGCPPPPVAATPEAPADRDTDGLPDLADQCPLLAEDHDGYRDDDGCPDPDNDLDLLADGFDADPLAPEDWDDFEDADGRPDLDNDRDGLADARDPCPTEKGGPDGCPESLATAERLPRADGPDAPLVLGRTLHPARPLPFTRAALAPEAAPLLDGLAAYLAAHPELDRVEIGVHTDGRGSAPRKRALARARAAAVRAALVTRGVDPGRLFTRGYGPDVPVDTDQTAAGRANNRRVELRALMPFEAAPTEPRRSEKRRARPRADAPEPRPRASREPRR